MQADRCRAKRGVAGRSAPVFFLQVFILHATVFGATALSATPFGDPASLPSSNDSTIDDIALEAPKPSSMPASTAATDAPFDADPAVALAESAEESQGFTLLGGTGRVSGELLGRYANDTRFEATSEDVFEARTRAQLKLDYRIAGKFRAFIGSRFDLWVKGAAPIRGNFYLLNARNVRADGFFELREAFVDFYTSWVDIRVGNQIFAWGQNELFSPADFLNPVDLRDPLSQDLFKKPVPAVQATVALSESGSLKLVWQPLFIGSDIPLFGSDFSVLVPGRAAERRLQNALRLIDPSVEARLQGNLVGTQIPNANPLNSTLAARLQYQLGGFDLALSGMVGWNRLPTVRVDPDLASLVDATPAQLQNDPDLRASALRTVQKLQLGQSLIDARYQRTASVAFDAATTWRDFSFKLDAGYQADAVFYRDDFTPIQKPLVRWVLGAEYNYGDTWSVWVSFFANHILDVAAGEQFAIIEGAFANASRPRSIFWAGVLLIARAKLLDDRLELRTTTVYNITLNDALATASATWNVSDYQHISVGGMMIVGGARTLFGQWSANNQIYAQYALTF